MSGQKDHPIIIVRRHKHKHALHGGAWKVAYAEFVTAMMAFFLVMWLSAQDSRVRDAIAGYFQEPGLLPHEQSNSLLASGQGGIDSVGMPVLKRQPAGMLEAEQKALATAAEHIQQHILKVPDFATLRDQVEFEVTTEGLRIELIDQSRSSFFDSGSSVLRGESTRMLEIIAQEIRELENDVVIEGHTDSQPYAANERYGNWELSVDRANSARRVMQEKLRTGQLRAVRGFADMDLRIPDEPLNPRNRRVSIVVRSHSVADIEAAVRELAGGGSGQ
jgi:chemotaxis protein MotB